MAPFNSLLNVIEGESSWLCLSEISINLNIIVYVYYCSNVGIFLFTCLRFLFFIKGGLCSLVGSVLAY